VRNRFAAAGAAALLAAAPPSGVPLAAQTSPGILVSTAWVASHLDDPSVVLLHVDGRRSSYDEAHIPGARFLDLGGISWPGEPAVGTEMRTPAEIAVSLEAAGVRDGQHVVVYGANPLAAARAWMTLDVMGWGGAASFMDGGLGAWQEEGRPVSTSEPAFAAGSVTLHPRAGVVVDADWVLAHLEDPSVSLLDARPDDEYTGADGGMGGRVHAGHIPGAYQIYWEEFVQSRPVHRIHPTPELKALFAPMGAAPGSTVVAYCMVGLRASYAYMVARILGYDARFYDGSWLDWGSRDLPYVSGMSRR
jgi:thiosulfate/3-mercaptopyruvate sulfurtransferase